MGTRLSPLYVTIVCVLALLAAPAPASAFQMGLQQDGLMLTPHASATARDMKRAGARIVRMQVQMNAVAAGCRGQSISQMRDHTNPCYDWAAPDRAVTNTRRRGMMVLASLTGLPDWVNGMSRGRGRWYLGTGSRFSRNSRYFAAFAYAAGMHYRPHSRRIHYWTIWNEPNSKYFWKPFHTSGRNAAPRLYARLYHNAASQLKRARWGNKVAAGPTGPKSTGMKPIIYLRAFQRQYGRMSNARAYLNAWAHNAYAGGKVSPYRAVLRPPNVGAGNIRDLFRALDAHATTRRKRVWVTEFAYESAPPDWRAGVPLRLQARWLGEGMDVFWSTRRVPIAIWYVIRDPSNRADWQSGLRRTNGRAKPAYAMYRRPVAVSAQSVRRGRAVRVWGKTNVGTARSARLEYSYNRRTWRRIRYQRSRGSVRIAGFRIYRTTYFRMRDGAGRGPRQRVRVR